jgi:hypothetical protein
VNLLESKHMNIKMTSHIYYINNPRSKRMFIKYVSELNYYASFRLSFPQNSRNPCIVPVV